jgi:hypothetical protein
VIKADRAVLSGTPDEVRQKIKDLSRTRDLQEAKAGERLRILAAELAQRDDLIVSVIRYENQSQELEVALAEFPECDPVVIDRNATGSHCQMSWERWLDIHDGPGIRHACDLVAELLKISAMQGMRGDEND